MAGSVTPFAESSILQQFELNIECITPLKYS